MVYGQHWKYCQSNGYDKKRSKDVFTKIQSQAEKIVKGRVGKFYSEICLVDQAFVKNPDMKVSELVASKNAKIVRYARFEKGEGIEKKEENFAEEVMKQLQ